MKRSLTAIFLALTMIITSISASATPARADEDVAKVLAGLALLGIIAAAVDDRNDRKAARNAQRHVTPKKIKRRAVAPNRCLRDQWTHRGWRQVYGAGCMRHHAQIAPPRQCLREARSNSGPRRFYTPRCLQKHGWRA